MNTIAWRDRFPGAGQPNGVRDLRCARVSAKTCLVRMRFVVDWWNWWQLSLQREYYPPHWPVSCLHVLQRLTCSISSNEWVGYTNTS